MPAGEQAGRRVEGQGDGGGAPPAVSVPLLLDTFSQAAVLPSDQLKAAFPALVKESVCVETVKGPPTGPLATAPLPGVIWKAVRLRQGDDQAAAGRAAPTGAKIIARHRRDNESRCCWYCCPP